METTALDVTIPLSIGENYISFPLRYEYSLMTLFTQSGIADSIAKLEKLDPISGNYISIDINFEYTEEGRGYKLTTKADTSILPIVYTGIEYPIHMTFDILRSILLKGWNLIGPGSDIITIPNWCKARDPKTMIPVGQLEPTKAYLMYYDECTVPTIDPLVPIFGAGLVISIVSLWLALRGRVPPPES